MISLEEVTASITSYGTTQLLLIATATALLVRYATKKKYNLPPGPMALPLLGNLLAFRGKSMTDVLSDWHKKHGPIVTVHVGPIPIIFINEINELTEAYVKGGSDFSGRPHIHSMDAISDGGKNIVFTTYGPVWKHQRKLAVQALRQYLTGRQLEERVSEALTPVIENMLSEKDFFDPHMQISLCVFNVIHGLCFGKTFQQDDPVFKNLVNLFDKSNDQIGNGFVEDFIPLLRLWPTKRFRSVMAYFEEFTEHIHKSYAECKDNFDENDMRSFADNIILAKKQCEREDTLEAKSFTDVHAGQTVADVFGAGVDTTRTTLDWIVFVLAARPEVQAKAQKELDEVVGSGIVPGKEHRAKLVYLEAVMLESMRLFPVVPVGLPHSTMCDSKVGSYDIPANTWVMSNQLEILHSEKDWSDPLSFKPERFLDKTGSHIVLRHAGWVPFSIGQRACMGESLAKLEMLYVLAGMLQKLTFTLDPNCKADLVCNSDGFLNRPVPYKVKVTSRIE